jgi:hypothetical protein
MKPTDAEKFGNVWGGAWAFYGKTSTPMMIGLAFQALRQYELDDISKALSIHLNDPDSGQFAPKPADVVKILDGSKGSVAMQAWSKVENAMARIGSYESVVFDDPIIHKVIMDMSDWPTVCQTTDKELPFKAIEFEKRYQGYMLRKPEIYPKKLIGITEADNSCRGFEEWVKKPVLIGDHEKAQIVYKNGSSKTVETKRLGGVAASIGVKLIKE